MKKFISFILILLFPMAAFAQEAVQQVSILNDPLLPLYVVIAFIVLVSLMVLIVAIYMIKILNMFVERAAQERATKLGIEYVPEPGFWMRFWSRISDMKPVEKEADIMLDHNYDGIKELDNHLPPWWKWLFYITMIWAVVYLVAYHVTDSLPLMDQEYQNEVAQADSLKARLAAASPAVEIDENALKYEPDDVILASGRTVYVNNCASCHKAQGEGDIGPNLTDTYWLHGGSVTDIYKTIENGVIEKGMIAWGPVLSQEKIRDVTFYIMSIQGSNPANPKAPQGELYVAPEQPASDSTNVVSDTLKVEASLRP